MNKYGLLEPVSASVSTSTCSPTKLTCSQFFIDLLTICYFSLKFCYLAFSVLIKTSLGAKNMHADVCR